jgi:hypothetical protein
MPEPDSAPAAHGQFTTTHWSMVLAAATDSTPAAQEALERLCRTYWHPLFDLLKDCVWGDKNALSLAEIAGRLDLTGEAVKKSVQRLRQRFRDSLRAEIAQTVATPDQIDEELRHLRAALSADL